MNEPLLDEYLMNDQMVDANASLDASREDSTDEQKDTQKDAHIDIPSNGLGNGSSKGLLSVPEDMPMDIFEDISSFSKISNDVLFHIFSYIPVLDLITGGMIVSKRFLQIAHERMKSNEVSLLQDDDIPIRNETNRWQSLTMVSRSILKLWSDRSVCFVQVLKIQLSHLSLFLTGGPLPTVRDLEIIKTTIKIGEKDQTLISQLPFTYQYNSDIFERIKSTFPNLQTLDIPRINQTQGLLDIYKQYPNLSKLTMAASVMKDFETNAGTTENDTNHAGILLFEMIVDIQRKKSNFTYGNYSFTFDSLKELNINSRESNLSFFGQNNSPNFFYIIERCPNLEKFTYHCTQSAILRIFEQQFTPDDESDAQRRMRLSYWKSLGLKSKLKEVKILDNTVDSIIHLFLKYVTTLESLCIEFGTSPLSILEECSNIDDLLSLIENNRSLRVFHVSDRTITSENYKKILSLCPKFESFYIVVKEKRPTPLLYENIFEEANESDPRMDIIGNCKQFGVWETSFYNLQHLTRRNMLHTLFVAYSDIKYAPKNFSSMFPCLEHLVVYCSEEHIVIESDTIKTLKLKSIKSVKSRTHTLTIDTSKLEDFRVSTTLLKDIVCLNLISNQKEPLRLQYAVSLQELYYTSPHQEVLVLFAKDLKKMELQTPNLSLLMASAHNFEFLEDSTFGNLKRALLLQSHITEKTINLFERKAKSLQNLLFFNCTFQLSGSFNQYSIFCVEKLIVNQLCGESIDVEELAICMPNVKHLSLQSTREAATLHGMISAVTIWKLNQLYLDSIITNADLEKILPLCTELTHLFYRSQIQESTPLLIPPLKKLWLLRICNSQILFQEKLPSLYNLELAPLKYVSPFTNRYENKDIFDTAPPEFDDTQDMFKKNFSIESKEDQLTLCVEAKEAFEYCPNLEEFCIRGIFTEETVKEIVEEALLKCNSISSLLFEFLRENIIARTSITSSDLLAMQDNLQLYINKMKPEHPPRCYCFVKC